jgi:hypothetical protein
MAEVLKRNGGNRPAANVTHKFISGETYLWMNQLHMCKTDGIISGYYASFTK